MDRVLYLHGLGSSGASSTVEGLRSLGLEVVAPDYRPQYFDESVAQLSELVATSGVELLAGTSMGGYYALVLSALTGLPVVAVNPCFEPGKHLAKYLTEPAEDFVSGEPICFTEAMLAAFQGLDSAAVPQPVIVVGEQDDLIPASYQKQFCTQRGWGWLSTDWGHRVGDKAQLAEILRTAVAGERR